MKYWLLIGAIVFEVIGTSCLKLITGERAVRWAIPAVGVSYLCAFGLMSLALARGLPLGVAYAVWSGLGVVLVAVVSWLVFGETLRPLQMGGAALIVAGVTMLELGAHHE